MRFDVTKNIFILDHHQNEEPISSSASLGFGKSICYGLINLVHRAFNSKLPVDSSTKLTSLTCYASHSHASDSRDVLSSNPQGLIKTVRARARLKVRFFRRLNEPLSGESRLDEMDAHSPILENQSHRKEQAPMSSPEEPAEDLYYYCFFNMLLGCQYNQFYIVIVMFYVLLHSRHEIKSQRFLLFNSAICDCAEVQC